LGSIFAFLRKHPILCLLLLTPGIPEYLGGSSPISAIVLNPGQFIFQLVANLGLYGTGVLLIREAMVRWQKGWASVLLLGGAYGILEEGVALSTLFYSKAAPVGAYGYFGHWLGVNWIWAAAIVPFHAVFSVSIPILLLSLALPSTRGKRLLSRRGVRSVFVLLVLDVSGLFLIVYYWEHFWMGFPVLVGSLIMISLLVYLARRITHSGRLARSGQPKKKPRTMALLGLAFFPAVLVTESFGKALSGSPVLVFCLTIAVQGLFLFYLLRVIGSSENTPQIIAFTFGLITPIAGIGLISEIAFPLVLVGDAAFVLFFRMLWRRYRIPSTPALSTQIPA
jgi:hypothetical protein